MATQFRLISVQTSKESYLSEARELFSKKISPFYKFEFVDIKSDSSGREDAKVKIKKESEKILKQISPGDINIVLDERGDLVTSEDWSVRLQKKLDSSPKRINFIVGGAFGLDQSIKEKANWTWSFSKLVMNHHVAQVVLLEQIYRGLAIIKGLPYHNS